METSLLSSMYVEVRLCTKFEMESHRSELRGEDREVLRTGSPSIALLGFKVANG